MTELAKRYRRDGDMASAIHWYRSAVDHGDAGASATLAELYGDMGDRAECERWYRRGAELGNPAATAGLGELLLQRDELDEAERWLRQSASQGHGELFLARVFARRGAYSEAETIVRDLAENADNEWAMIDLGMLLERRGQFAEAQTWYESATVDGDYPGLLARRVDAKQRGDHRAAAEFDLLARAAQPDSRLRLPED
jgi:TPR repeat protein